MPRPEWSSGSQSCEESHLAEWSFLPCSLVFAAQPQEPQVGWRHSGDHRGSTPDSPPLHDLPMMQELVLALLRQTPDGWTESVERSDARGGLGIRCWIGA